MEGKNFHCRGLPEKHPYHRKEPMSSSKRAKTCAGNGPLRRPARRHGCFCVSSHALQRAWRGGLAGGSPGAGRSAPCCPACTRHSAELAACDLANSLSRAGPSGSSLTIFMISTSSFSIALRRLNSSCFRRLGWRTHLVRGFSASRFDTKLSTVQRDLVGSDSPCE